VIHLANAICSVQRATKGDRRGAGSRPCLTNRGHDLHKRTELQPSDQYRSLGTVEFLVDRGPR